MFYTVKYDVFTRNYGMDQNGNIRNLNVPKRTYLYTLCCFFLGGEHYCCSF